MCIATFTLFSFIIFTLFSSFHLTHSPHHDHPRQYLFYALRTETWLGNSAMRLKLHIGTLFLSYTQTDLMFSILTKIFYTIQYQHIIKMLIQIYVGAAFYMKQKNNQKCFVQKFVYSRQVMKTFQKFKNKLG